MTNLRALAEQDTAHTIEGEFRTPITISYPNGDKQNLYGRVLWSQARSDANGAPVVVPNPVVDIRRSRLSQSIKTGDKVAIRMPSGPRADAPLATFLLDITRAVGGSKLFGLIKLPLIVAGQKPAEDA